VTLKLDIDVSGVQYKTVWKPLPGSQSLALDSRCNHTLFCGTRGGGKTETQLMRFRKNVGRGYGAFWRGIIFDKEYKNLDDIVAKSKRLFFSFKDGAKFLASKGEYKWIWPTGEELLLRVGKDETDYDDYHGHEYPFIGWNELTKYATSAFYDKMMSCNRSSFLPDEHSPVDDNGNMHLLPPIPLEVFSTTNSFGVGRVWVMRRYITPGKYGTVIRRTVRIFDPATKKEVDVTKTQVAIFSSFRENKYLAKEYIAELYLLSDPNLRQSWLYGNWNVSGGGAISDVWREKVHVIPRFTVPDTWRIDRAFDWGSTHPYGVGWFAECNGEEALVKLPNGNTVTFCPPAGTLILIYELYGTVELGTNKGLKHSAKQICDLIKDCEAGLTKGNWIKTVPRPGPADNQINNNMQQDEETIKKKMEDQGIYWETSDKSPGSRVNGLSVFRDMLQATINNDQSAHFYVMENCINWIDLVPNLPNDEKKLDDVDTTSEDHLWDLTRYRALKGSNRMATSLELNHSR
jgi:hypothetical protein